MNIWLHCLFSGYLRSDILDRLSFFIFIFEPLLLIELVWLVVLLGCAHFFSSSQTPKDLLDWWQGFWWSLDFAVLKPFSHFWSMFGFTVYDSRPICDQAFNFPTCLEMMLQYIDRILLPHNYVLVLDPQLLPCWVFFKVMSVKDSFIITYHLYHH